jgi:hypothetical protein
MKTLSFGMFMIASTLVGACATQGGSSTTTPGEDELGAEVGDGEQAKADSQDNFGYLEVRKIGAFECNGVGSCTHLELDRANRTTTVCADNKSAAVCQARTLDLSKLTVTQAKKNAIMTALQNQAGNPDLGTQVLVRGKFVHGTNPLTPTVDWVTFQPTEVWVAQLADGSADGTFVRVNDNGRRCIDAPCAATHEGRLNSVKTLDVDGLDYADGVAASLTEKVYTAMTTPDGAIVAGDRTHGTMMHLPTTLRSVNQVYLRVK